MLMYLLAVTMLNRVFKQGSVVIACVLSLWWVIVAVAWDSRVPGVLCSCLLLLAYLLVLLHELAFGYRPCQQC